MPPDVFEVVFSPGTITGTTVCYPCTIIDYDNLEVDHSFSVHIQAVSPNLMGITTDPPYTTVEITDDEGEWCSQLVISRLVSRSGHFFSLYYVLFSIAGETVSVGFEQTSYQASENGPLNEEVCAVISNLVGDLECNLTVTFGAVSNNKSGEFHASIHQCGTLWLRSL